MTKTTANTKEIAITVIGPNGVPQLEVHAAGCADLNRPKYRRSERTDETITSLEGLTWSWYQDMIAESDDPENWESYSNEFKIFPCVGHLPHTEADATAPAPAKPAAKSRKVSAPKAAPAEKLTSAQKREVRVKMAAVLRAMRTSPLNEISAAEMAYIEAHWLKYIDPELDAARRAAA